MGLNVGARGEETKAKEIVDKLDNHIVLDKVIVRERVFTVDVPVIKYTPKEVEYEKPIIKEVENIKYKTIDQVTTKYNVKNEDTVKFNTIEVPTIKFIPQDQMCEKPIIVEKEYEKPIIKEKVYELNSVKNIEEIVAFNTEIKKLNEELPKLVAHLNMLKDYKLVEQIVKVPKLEWETVKAERIEWVPVKREMPDVFVGGK